MYIDTYIDLGFWEGLKNSQHLNRTFAGESGKNGDLFRMSGIAMRYLCI